MNSVRARRTENVEQRVGWKTVLVFSFSVLCSLFSTGHITHILAADRISPVTVEAKVLKNKIRIGDEIKLYIQVDHPRKVTVQPPSAKSNLRPFEIKAVDTSPVKKGQNRVQETFVLTLTVFELGDLKIPAVPMTYQNESGDAGEVRTEPVAVKVLGALTKLTDKDDIRPIKGPVSIGFVRFWTWLLGFLAGLLFIFLIAKLLIRIIGRNKDDESRKPPHERVILELKRLKDQGYLEEKKYKEFYSELSDILRRYLERAYKIEALEQTTSELLETLKQKDFDPAVLRNMKEVLEESDLIKFAKFVPERSTSEKLEGSILSIVDETKPKPVKK